MSVARVDIEKSTENINQTAFIQC